MILNGIYVRDDIIDFMMLKTDGGVTRAEVTRTNDKTGFIRCSSDQYEKAIMQLERNMESRNHQD